MVDQQVLSPEEERNQTAYSRIGWVPKLLVIICIALIWYQVSSTKEVPNLTYTNFTNVVTNTTVLVPHIRYNETSVVPAGTVTPTYAMFESMIFVILIWMLAHLERRPNDTITIHEAIALIEKDVVKFQREERLPRGDVHINPYYKLQHIVLPDNTRIPFKYIIDVQLINLQRQGLTEYYRAEVDARTKYSLSIIPTRKPLDRQDVCGNCGSAADVKIITAENIREYGQFKQLFGGRVA